MHLNHAGPNTLNRADGIVLRLLFAVFLYYTTLGVIANRRTDPLLEEVRQETHETPPKVRTLAMDLLATFGGMLMVGAGGRATVMGALMLAKKFGVPESVVGLIIISFGTTLPELTTCIAAARRGNSDIALGNVVGSNIFNLLFVGGACATLRPVVIPAGGIFDLLVMAGLSFALFPLSLTGKRHITRTDGALLMSGYIAYIVWRGATAII
jgi:cation:H+ antiporter